MTPWREHHLPFWRFVRAWLDCAPWRRRAAEPLRCIMGYPVSETLRCRRLADADGLWCRRHQPEAKA